jgi:cell division protease FtsH
MVMEYGMSDRLGPMKYGSPEGEVFLGKDYTQHTDYSDDVASAIDEEVRRLITQAHEEARVIITTHREALDRMAAELIEKETVDGDEIAAIFHDVPKWEHAANGSVRIQAPNGKMEGDVAAVKATGDGEPT